MARLVLFLAGVTTPTPLRSDSWYLDPVVARQKADAFLALVERWRDPAATGLTLKTLSLIHI